jgi:hypothetical protein
MAVAAGEPLRLIASRPGRHPVKAGREIRHNRGQRPAAIGQHLHVYQADV